MDIVQMPLKNWQAWDIDHFSRKPVPLFGHQVSKEMLPNVQPELPLVQQWTIPTGDIPGYQGYQYLYLHSIFIVLPPGILSLSKGHSCSDLLQQLILMECFGSCRLGRVLSALAVAPEGVLGWFYQTYPARISGPQTSPHYLLQEMKPPTISSCLKVTPLKRLSPACHYILLISGLLGPFPVLFSLTSGISFGI